MGFGLRVILTVLFILDLLLDAEKCFQDADENQIAAAAVLIFGSEFREKMWKFFLLRIFKRKIK